jgi:hypothetical protein
MDLGGPANIRHELRLGLLDDDAHDELVRWIANHHDQPLEDLPDSFSEEAAVVVTRQ